MFLVVNGENIFVNFYLIKLKFLINILFDFRLVNFYRIKIVYDGMRL